MKTLDSRLYVGWIRHRRFLPKLHDFKYPIFMSWLALDEIELVTAKSRVWSLERFNLVSFYRKDYLGQNDDDLQETVKAQLQNHTGQPFKGRIYLLTHLRYLGFCFNPASFYFCYPDQAEQPRYIIVEIHNTPWNERYCYILDTQQCQAHSNDRWQFEFDKAFHVSPFMPMEMHYEWRFVLHKENLTIHMVLQQNDESCFDATLQLKEQAMTTQAMRSIPLRFPLMTLSVVMLIYWQALLLWLKRIPFYSHPDKKSE
ncbi:DUF1365 domain-containing protein [Methyloglobulus sp.]|uniref:DUF1365 domain-containing protein n=1 Tax=Methyloglobulus sp. TaxID=2518622 RepID=UPI0032B83538